MGESIPNINTVEKLKSYLKPFYVIDDYMSSPEEYREFQESIYAIIKGCFEWKTLRDYPVKFKFYNKDMEFHTLKLRHFVINVFYWFPFVELHSIKNVMDSDFIIDCTRDIPKIDERINQFILCLRDYNVKNTHINYYVSEVLYNLRRISGDFSLIMGLNFDMFTIIRNYLNNDKMREIMETKIDEQLQPYEIEEILKQKEKELVELLMSIPNDPFGVILKSGTGMKHKQLVEFLIAKGLIPDLSGNTISLPIKNSIVIGGLKTPADLFIDASGARKSLIMSHKVMGRAGHFGKVLTELSRTLKLSTTVSDCGTHTLVKYHVNDKKFLQKLNGKYFTISPDDFDSLRPINSKKDTDLIGKTIYVRSAATCALKNEVCAKCFGLMANLNFDIADGIGAFLSEEVSKVVEQNILSTKHLLTTMSDKILFNEEFSQFFAINSDEISPIVNESDLDDINDWAIIIDKSDLMKADEMDSDDGFNTYITDGGFKVKNMKTGKIILMQEDNHKEIFLTDECLQLMKKGKGAIYFKDMDDDTVLFVITILNNELTKPLYELMNLVNRDKSSVIDRNIDDVSQRFVELLVESKIDAAAISAEIIINRLIRCADNIFERPDFSSIRTPEYKIVTIAKALEKNKSPLVGLSYQYIKRQLLDDETFEVKDGTSYLDPFFKKKVSTKKRKAHIRYMQEKRRKEREEINV